MATKSTATKSTATKGVSLSVGRGEKLPVSQAAPTPKGKK